MLATFDGVMIGREAYQNPWMLVEADALIFGESSMAQSPGAVLDALFPYIERNLAEGVPLNAMTRHLLGLFQGRPGAKAWRRALSEQAHRAGAGIEVLREAAAKVLHRT
jgi:tRNA-dihydrouridine synthase A